MSTECTSGQQAFAGAYVLLGAMFTFSVLHESAKLIYRHQTSQQQKLSATPRYLFYISMVFIALCIISLIKCMVYGLSHCDYLSFSDSFSDTVFKTLFQDLYAIQLYLLWMVLLFRLYYTVKRTPYQLPPIVIKIYIVILILLALLTMLIMIPSVYHIIIVLSFSCSLFITLSLTIMYGFKHVQIFKYWPSYKDTQECALYTIEHDLDLLTNITRITILTGIATSFSFVVLLILMFIRILSVISVQLAYQDQVLDVCLLLDTYITAICILYQFKYLHSKYTFCCNCIDIVCKFYCNKYLNNDASIPETKGIIANNRISISLRPPSNDTILAMGGPEKRQRIISDTTDIETMNHEYIAEEDRIARASHDYDYNGMPAELEMANTRRKGSDVNNSRNSSAGNPMTSRSGNIAPRSPIHQTLFTNVNRVTIERILIKERDWSQAHTKRAMAVYEKHYGTAAYDINVVEEIIYRLTVKDKIKELQKIQNLYQSRENVASVLSSLRFSKKYIDLALMLYEVMAETFEIDKYHKDIYDLELITEMIMRLRAKFSETGHRKEGYDGRTTFTVSNTNTNNTNSPDRQTMEKSNDVSLASEYKVQEPDMSGMHASENRVRPLSPDGNPAQTSPAYAAIAGHATQQRQQEIIAYNGMNVNISPQHIPPQHIPPQHIPPQHIPPQQQPVVHKHGHYRQNTDDVDDDVSVPSTHEAVNHPLQVQAGVGNDLLNHESELIEVAYNTDIENGEFEQRRNDRQQMAHIHVKKNSATSIATSGNYVMRSPSKRSMVTGQDEAESVEVDATPKAGTTPSIQGMRIINPSPTGPFPDVNTQLDTIYSKEHAMYLDESTARKKLKMAASGSSATSQSVPSSSEEDSDEESGETITTESGDEMIENMVAMQQEQERKRRERKKHPPPNHRHNPQPHRQPQPQAQKQKFSELQQHQYLQQQQQQQQPQAQPQQNDDGTHDLFIRLNVGPNLPETSSGSANVNNMNMIMENSSYDTTTPNDSSPWRNNGASEHQSEQHSSESAEIVTMEDDEEAEIVTMEDEEEEHSSAEDYDSEEAKDHVGELIHIDGDSRRNVLAARRQPAQRHSFSSTMASLRVSGSWNEEALLSMRAVMIEQEIIETEKTYLAGLHVLLNEFISPIFDLEMLPAKYRKRVTCNIPQLIQFHSHFLRELLKESVGSIAKTFNQHGDYLKMYIGYVTEYRGILEIFAKSKKNKKLEAYLTRKRVQEQKTLTSFLILPVQRIPRYMLLLDELKKKTPTMNQSEYRNIENALKKVELICNEINERQREIENVTQGLELTHKLKGLNINIVQPTRKYVQHFIFRRRSDQRNTQFFLFSDVVIIADMKWRTEQIVKLTKFDAKRPSKKNEEVLIRIIQGHTRKSSNMNDKSQQVDNDEPVLYVPCLEMIEKEQNQHICNIDLFCRLLNKYRNELYQNEISRHNAMEASRSKSHGDGLESRGNSTSDHSISQSVDSELVGMIRQEHDKQQLAQWQNDRSKGSKRKVLNMLKSPSENSDQ